MLLPGADVMVAVHPGKARGGGGGRGDEVTRLWWATFASYSLRMTLSLSVSLSLVPGTSTC